MQVRVRGNYFIAGLSELIKSFQCTTYVLMNPGYACDRW